MVVGKQAPVVGHEVLQSGNLLDIGRNVRVVALQVHVVELDDDHVLD
jgi:hypothetical protein